MSMSLGHICLMLGLDTDLRTFVKTTKGRPALHRLGVYCGGTQLMSLQKHILKIMRRGNATHVQGSKVCQKREHRVPIMCAAGPSGPPHIVCAFISHYWHTFEPGTLLAHFPGALCSHYVRNLNYLSKLGHWVVQLF